jgi:hypothetical protein
MGHPLVRGRERGLIQISIPGWNFLRNVHFLNKRIGAEVRVSHISPKTGEIWGTLWFVAGKEG